MGLFKTLGLGLLRMISVVLPMLGPFVNAIANVALHKRHRRPPVHVPPVADQYKYPPPGWLPNTGIHWAIVGERGVGKSTLSNLMRGGLTREHPDFAPVGVVETTTEPKRYNFPGCPKVSLWDLPGCGTMRFPAATYISTYGLRYFAGIILVLEEKFPEIYAEIIKHLEEFRVPYYLVRSKMDMAVDNNRNDYNIPAEETCVQVRRHVTQQLLSIAPNASPSRVYVLSARRGRTDIGDWSKFSQDLAADLERSFGE
jgi:GTPase SAR1 family protein